MSVEPSDCPILRDGDVSNQEFEIQTAVGKLRAKGYHLGNLLQIIGAALLALVAYMLYDAKVESSKAAAVLAVSTERTAAHIEESSKTQHGELKVAIDKQTESNIKQREAQEESNYILTLSSKDRERLNMRMPDSLRRKLRDR